MTPFQIIAVLLTFVAIGGYINHKYFHLPETIGHMAFALLLSLGAIILYKFGLFDLAPGTVAEIGQEPVQPRGGRLAQRIASNTLNPFASWVSFTRVKCSFRAFS